MTAEDPTREASQRLLDFIHASPTPFHAVATAEEMLRAQGFAMLEESDSWDLQPGGRYMVTRNGSSLAAFVVGRATCADAGARIIGAHTDSPNLRLKPEPYFEAHGYQQLAIEIYGGALVASWTDRDLGLAGRIMVDEGDGRIARRLVRVDRPVARIPQIAIHLDREVNERGLMLNKETQLPPLIGMAGDTVRFPEWLAEEAGLGGGKVLGHELMFFDVAPPVFAGIDGSFLHAPRLDNLASCHAALTALIEGLADAGDCARVVVLYDNEEIGSATRQGAAGPFLGDLLERIVAAEEAAGTRFGEAGHRARARSFFLSADMAHAIHPNYADKHESRHRPRLNGGPVLKYNANARYATDAETAALFAKVCEEAAVPCQKMVMRADMPCGSTIGPIVATRLGVRSVDVGNPMLSMHSCREMAGARDHALMVRAMTRFFVR